METGIAVAERTGTISPKLAGIEDDATGIVRRLEFTVISDGAKQP